MCVNFNQWKNSANYETFLYNILQNSQVFQDFFAPQFLRDESFSVIN
jgi:hypothetical protein